MSGLLTKVEELRDGAGSDCGVLKLLRGPQHPRRRSRTLHTTVGYWVVLRTTVGHWVVLHTTVDPI